MTFLISIKSASRRGGKRKKKWRISSWNFPPSKPQASAGRHSRRERDEEEEKLEEILYTVRSSSEQKVAENGQQRRL